MKKRIERIVAAAVLSAVLCACGKEAEQGGRPTEEPTQPVAEPTQQAEEATPTVEPTQPAVEATPTPTPIAERVDWCTQIDHYVMSPDVAAFFPTDEASRMAFERAIDGIIAHEPLIPLTDDWDKNLTIWMAVDESPYYFVVEDAELSADHSSLEVKYKYEAEEAAEKLQFIDDSYIEILNECITPDMSELEKVLSIYHYFASSIQYDYVWYNELMATDVDMRFLTADIAVYDALSSGYGVCHSYTYLCQFAFQQLGIECLRVTSERSDGEGHMWPVVRIDGVYYDLDPTWDSQGDGTVGLAYFGMTDEEATVLRDFADYHIGIDMTYGDFVCEDERFADLRDVVDYQMNYDGTISVIREDGREEIVDLDRYRE